jgi:hypothetical protein
MELPRVVEKLFRSGVVTTASCAPAVTLATSNLITHAHMHMSRLAATWVWQPQTGMAIRDQKYHHQHPK